MPKEQPCLNECHPCSSSKNDKDKSNSTTVQALCGAKELDNSSARGCSSEKDSGYSDNGSDWQQTDVEDQRSNKAQSRSPGCEEAPLPGQNQDPKQGDHENNFITPGNRELPPIYIIKNMVLKQSDMIQKRHQLLWRTGGMDTSGPGSTRMILFQQPNLLPTSLNFHKSRNTNVKGKNSIGAYLPILNSYPRIAPHPSKKPPDKSSSGDESENTSKRVCTEHTSNDMSTIRSLLEQQLHQQPKLAVSVSGQPGQCSSSPCDSSSSSCPTSVSPSACSPSVSGRYSSSFFTRALLRNGLSSIHNHRFLNTLEILSQSGLLDITLRTKELLRQSNTTDRDIAQLRHHTELLCQVASNPNGNMSWENLHRAMAESGSYPNLKSPQNVQIHSHPDSASQQESGSTRDTNRPLAVENSDVPPSQLPTGTSGTGRGHPEPQQSHLEQDREHKASGKSEKVTIMPPDSSTD